jgi:hypothetical protein
MSPGLGEGHGMMDGRKKAGGMEEKEKGRENNRFSITAVI